MQKIIIIAVAFSAGFLTGARFFSSAEPPIPIQQSLSPAIDNQQLLDQIADLSRHVDELESRSMLALEQFSPMATANPSLPEPTSHAATADADTDELQRLREYQFNNEIKKHQARIQDIGADAHNMGEKMEQQFAAEVIDAAWADAKKTHLDSAIERDENLSSLPNLSSECRSRQCRLSILTKDADELLNLNTALDRLVAQKKLFESYTVVVDEKNYNTEIYFDRTDATH